MDFELQIPTEILDIIFEKLGEDLASSSKACYASLMLVCKRWCSVGQKHIFRNIDMPGTFVRSRGGSRSFQFSLSGQNLLQMCF
ncbi:hypothetical protein BT69DRAFT_228662 [Atractiella rhizophila]|nr:hypothetical protein BT69DRAFT_228662 [Atractiella rhizophila]